MLVAIGVCGIYICMIGTDQKLSHNRRSDRYTLLQVPSKHRNSSCPELSSTSYFQQHYPQPKTFRRYITTSFCELNASKPKIGNMWKKCQCDYTGFVTSNLKISSTLLSSIRSEGVSFVWHTFGNLFFQERVWMHTRTLFCNFIDAKIRQWMVWNASQQPSKYQLTWRNLCCSKSQREFQYHCRDAGHHLQLGLAEQCFKERVHLCCWS